MTRALRARLLAGYRIVLPLQPRVRLERRRAQSVGAGQLVQVAQQWPPKTQRSPRQPRRRRRRRRGGSGERRDLQAEGCRYRGAAAAAQPRGCGARRGQAASVARGAGDGVGSGGQEARGGRHGQEAALLQQPQDVAGGEGLGGAAGGAFLRVPALVLLLLRAAVLEPHLDWQRWNSSSRR